mgnify:CR=1 FL=1|jgi:cytochrome oxidase Cu insertion factor (SCO1/SenC/PrrC family)
MCTPFLKHLPNIKLVNENNIVSNFHDIVSTGTIVISMFYSRCVNKCIPLGKIMKRVHTLLGEFIEQENIHFISITLNSKQDSIDDLNYYKSEIKANGCENWHFFKGEHSDVELLRRQLGMYIPEPDIDSVMSNHSGNSIIVNNETLSVKHVKAFENPINCARKILQQTTKNFPLHSGQECVLKLTYDSLTADELFENVHSISSRFTTPFFPDNIKQMYMEQVEKQRGFDYDPLNIKGVVNEYSDKNIRLKVKELDDGIDITTSTTINGGIDVSIQNKKICCCKN